MDEKPKNRSERRRLERMGGDAPVSDARAGNAAKARVRAAEGRLDAGDTAGALEKLKEAQRLDPRNMRAWYLAAMIDFNDGRLEEASDAILRAGMIDAKNPEVHANCAAIMNVCDRPMEAEAAARFAIELAPDMPEAHCNLGVALEAQGKVAEARDELAKAAELRPGYAEALISLGNLWFRAGDYLSAVEAFADAVRGSPTNAMARTNLAVALRHAGELSAAEQQCMEALQLDRGYAEAHNALGNVRLQLGDLPGAIDAFGDAVKLRDEYVEARANLAGAHFKAGDIETAEQTYLDVLERRPEFAEAALGLGVVLLAAGRTEDALSRFRRAVETRPALGEAWMNIVDASSDPLSEDDLAELRKRAGDARLAEEDRIAFLFALAKAEDDAGDAGAAFKAAAAANDRRRRTAETAGTAFDADAFDEEVTSVIEAIDAATIDRLSTHGDQEAEMIFICGLPRSGTTLVDQMLTRHPGVGGAGEVDILSGLLDAYPDEVAALNGNDVRELSDMYLSRLLKRPTAGQCITDKTPQNVFFLGFAKILFPRAKVVHCRRDPDDAALSCFFQNFRAAGLDWSTRIHDIRRYQAAEERMIAYWRDVLGADIIDIDYEDVVTNTETEARRLLAFLNLEWDDAVTRPHEGTGTVLTASNWQVRRPVYTHAKGRAAKYKHLMDGDA